MDTAATRKIDFKFFILIMIVLVLHQPSGVLLIVAVCRVCTAKVIYDRGV